MGKITREEIRRDLEEDIVINYLRDMQSWYVRNKTLLWGGIGLFAVAWLVYTIGGSISQSRLSQANDAITFARINFTQGVLREGPEQEQFFQESDQRLRNIVAQYRGKPLGRRAHTLLINHLFVRNLFGEARQELDAYASVYTDAEEQAWVAYATAYLYMNESFASKDPALLEDAMSHFEKAEKLAGSDSYLRFAAMQGRAELLGRDPATRSQAVELLETLIKERTPLAEQANATQTASEGLPEENEYFEILNLDGNEIIDLAKEEIKRLKALN